MRPELLVFSRSELEQFVQNDHSEYVAIRIVNPKWKAHLESTSFQDEIRLEFWDVEDQIGSYTPINLDQANSIVKFLKKHKAHKRFVFQCEAGESRSYTCALFFADKILGDDVLVGLLSSNQNRSINFAVWNALSESFKKEIP